MIPITTLVGLLNENRFDDLIAEIEGSNFPPDRYDFESAHMLRQMKRRLLMHLGDRREMIEKTDWAQDKELRPVKDAFVLMLAMHADLQLVVVLQAYELVSKIDESMENLEKVEKFIRNAMRMYKRKESDRKKYAARDAMIIELARKSGLPSKNKQADYIHENWDNTDLSEYKRLSSERIRKILPP